MVNISNKIPHDKYNSKQACQEYCHRVTSAAPKNQLLVNEVRRKLELKLTDLPLHRVGGAEGEPRTKKLVIYITYIRRERASYRIRTSHNSRQGG